MKMNELPFECTAKSSRGGCIKDNRETGSFASLGRIDEVVGWFARGVGGGGEVEKVTLGCFASVHQQGGNERRFLISVL